MQARYVDKAGAASLWRRVETELGFAFSLLPWRVPSI